MLNTAGYNLSCINYIYPVEICRNKISTFITQKEPVNGFVSEPTTYEDMICFNFFYSNFKARLPFKKCNTKHTVFVLGGYLENYFTHAVFFTE